MAAGRFSGFLMCNFKFCGEVVVVAGDYQEHVHYQYDDRVDEEVPDVTTTYTPGFFSPPPCIIALPKKLTDKVEEHLSDAFGLLWVDAAACANRLRIAVEYLLDQLAVPRKGKRRNGKNGDLDLSERIEALDIVRPGHKSALNALRHVGNTGSHEGTADFEDVLDCFELLEDAMLELIEERKQKLEETAKRLSQKRGKPQA